MRSSRGLLQKKERETKLKNIMTSTVQSKQDQSNTVKAKLVERARVVSAPVSRPSNTTSSSRQPKKYEDEYEEEEHSDHHEEDEDLENDELFDELSEEEVPIKKVESKPSKPVSKPVKQQAQPQTKQTPSKKVVVEIEEQQEEDHYEEDDHQENNDVQDSRKKRSIAIVSKTVLSKLIHDAGVEGVSSDVYSYMITEMQHYIREVLKVIAENADDDELVVRESDLKFLGDKSRASGTLDIKSFERLYAGVADSMNTNAEFSSGAFKAFCAHTEIEMVRFLKKARELITCYNKKRLGAKDLECLKKMLDDSE